MSFFSKHAAEQLRARGISHAEAREAHANVVASWPSDDPHPVPATVLIGRTAAGRLLKLVVRTDEPDYVVTIARRDEDG